MTIDEATLLEWTRTELLVPASHLAYAWGCDIRALTAACKRDELFLVEAFGERWCLEWWTQERREDVQRICRAHGCVDPLDALEFWYTPHDKLGGRRVVMTLGMSDSERGVDVAREFGMQWRARRLGEEHLHNASTSDNVRLLAEAVVLAVTPDGGTNAVGDEDRRRLAMAWHTAASIMDIHKPMGGPCA